jgi:beta-glucosidase
MELSRKFIFLLFLLLFCFVTTKGALYKNPKLPIRVRVNDLIKRMTLAEKIGQMSQIERLNATDDAIKNYFIGKFIFL